MSHDETQKDGQPLDDEVELKGRRDFLISLGKWSKVIVGSALLGGCNGYGGTGWMNGRGYYGGWVNHRGGGWINGRGGWINGRRYYGGGGWVNRRGGGGWINRR